MTENGVAKVSDFGLARGRAAADERSGPSAGQSILVSWGGMTPAYCSPEQAAKKPLSRKTDIYSWGVSVLEMFTGGVTWGHGSVAAAALEAYLAGGAPGPQLPLMPGGVAEVLRKCLRRESDERWTSLTDTVKAMRHAYRAAVGKNYARETPAGGGQLESFLVEPDRHTKACGFQWSDPRKWLNKSFEVNGRKTAEAEALLAVRAGSRMARAIADLIPYEEARHTLARFNAAGRKDLKHDLATLYFEKALIHEYLADLPGVVTLCDHAIAISEHLVNWESRRDLARAYLTKANAVIELGDNLAARSLYDQAIAFYERLVNHEHHRELADELGMAYLSKGNAFMRLGSVREALLLCDQAIALYERQKGGHVLAMAYVNKANEVALALEDRQGALGLLDQAIAIYERLMNQERRRDLANELAAAYMNKGSAIKDLGNNQAAVRLYELAIGIWEGLVNQQGHRDLAKHLATAYHNKAAAVWASGDKPAAVSLFNQAIAIRERLVCLEDHRELAGDLAKALLNRARALFRLKDRAKAQDDARRGIAILERAIAWEKRPDLQEFMLRAKSDLKELL
jgi:tetratricopeptide (TPR) repeat protein